MMQLDELIARVKQTQRGFLDIHKVAEEFFECNEIDSCIDIAVNLLESDIYQVRMLSTFIFGFSASESNACLVVLRNNVSLDQDWRV